MTTYARPIDGSWIDVYTLPLAYNPQIDTLAKLEKALGVSGFVQVPDAVKHGDFVVNGNDYAPRPVPQPPAVAPVYKSLSQPVVQEILSDIFGDTRYLAVDAALSALSTDAWKVKVKKFNNTGAIFTRQKVIDFLTDARQAEDRKSVV